ncbi:anti-sigma factor [Terrabacter sp. Soil811]|uniref:anti-sigma factor n=1 Tax=Terrabacter sp. Soil811 TaxID=1736419 RepID=UPI0006F779A6|nr:anti-sigma factor [Terrabacter sp. Soil811]KRF40032.1 anti-sigma factor [Terrabacter sp. Soil811]
MSEDIHALSGAYAVDALDDVERARFERHLAGCTACQAEVESLVAAASELSVLTEAAPPASLRAKVLAEIATVRPLPPLTAPQHESVDEDVTSSTPPEPVQAPAATAAPATQVEHADDLTERRRSRSTRGLARGWRVVVAAATVAVLAIGGFTVWKQIDKDPSRAIADQVLAAPDATRYGQRLAGGATATVVRSNSLHKAVIVTSGMSQPPSGKVFQLWLQDATGHMTSAGLMPGGGDQVVVLSGDASHSKGAGITVEPDGGSDQPTSDPVAFIAFA